MRALRISPFLLAGLMMLVGMNILAIIWLANVLQLDSAAEVAAVSWTPDTASENKVGISLEKMDSASSQTLARPIFFKDRRPYVPPPPSPPARPPQTVPAAKPAPPVITNPGLTLLGTSITNDGKRAFLTHASKAGGDWVQEGDEIMGWQVNRILPEQVTLQKAGHSLELVLYEHLTRR